jgi:hypothetical protein
MENDNEKREVLAEFRGQGSDPSIYEKNFDNSYTVHGHINKYFWVLTESEREKLFEKKLVSLLNKVEEGGYQEINDTEINSIICGGSDDFNSPFESNTGSEYIDGYYVLKNPVSDNYDWKEIQEGFKEKK